MEEEDAEEEEEKKEKEEEEEERCVPDPVDRQHERYNAADAGLLSFSATFNWNKQMQQKLGFDFNIAEEMM